nr:carbon-nitrogen hydrolase family protein [Anaerolineae bacterium]
MRVAAAQFAVLTDVSANLATVLRMIDQAAECKPDVIVLPEFCNHCAWYPSQEYAYEVGLDLHGDFVAAVAAKAKTYACYIMLNGTVRREYPTLTVTNILLGPDGQIVATSDKQTLMGNENNFASRAKELGPIVNTPLARFGMYSCMDGVIPETARGLALRGAQVLLNSLNSFAHDEADLHIPCLLYTS